MSMGAIPTTRGWGTRVKVGIYFECGLRSLSGLRSCRKSSLRTCNLWAGKLLVELLETVPRESELFGKVQELTEALVAKAA